MRSRKEEVRERTNAIRLLLGNGLDPVIEHYLQEIEKMVAGGGTPPCTGSPKHEQRERRRDGAHKA